MIPQIEPRFGLREAEELSKYIVNGGWGTDHTYTREFEGMLCECLHVPHCSVTTSGTQAIVFALMALGVGYGDEVLVPALTMIATANAVTMVGAIPVFVDVDESGCMDLSKAKEKINDKTKCVIYVSLNGRSELRSSFIDEMNSLGIRVIEDACQAFMSNGAGTKADIGCFSLSPHKLISTGQGGFSVTSDEVLYDKLRELKDFGRIVGGADIHPAFGVNGKFTDFQAVIGLTQLETLSDRVEGKRRVFERYQDRLAGAVDFIEMVEGEVPWFVDVYVERPLGLHSFLKERGIGSRPMYPVLNTQPIYQSDEQFFKASELSERGLWLPSNHDLTDEQIDTVCYTIFEFLNKR